MQIQSTNSRADQLESVGPPDLDDLYGSDDKASLSTSDDVTVCASKVSQVGNHLSKEPISSSNQVSSTCNNKLKEVID